MDMHVACPAVRARAASRERIHYKAMYVYDRSRACTLPAYTVPCIGCEPKVGAPYLTSGAESMDASSLLTQPSISDSIVACDLV